jgi:hypothetical protein
MGDDEPEKPKKPSKDGPWAIKFMRGPHKDKALACAGRHHRQMGEMLEIMIDFYLAAERRAGETPGQTGEIIEAGTDATLLQELRETTGSAMTLFDPPPPLAMTEYDAALAAVERIERMRRPATHRLPKIAAKIQRRLSERFD